MKPRLSLSWPAVAAAALLLCAGFAAGWFAGRSQAPAQPPRDYTELDRW